ncbi:glycosyltransferase family 4 protein [Candidatus Pelagibacter bacterium nBUS_27]|uniref:glycosyltransferase family 4 protein n=1 Tax=Candidatus Pelagibacter bacterium nBUS_27 TaxID=3374188 RepID=UPI003EB9CD68
MIKNKNNNKKIIIFTPYYNPEPFPINNFIEELAGRKEIEEVKIITSLPNYRNYKFYDGFNFLGPYKQRNGNINITRLPIIPRTSNSGISIFLFYISFFFSSSIFLFFFSLFNRNKYDHILTFCGSPVFVGYIGFLASKILNTQSSQWVQDIWPEAIETTVGIKNNTLKNIVLKLQNYMWNLCDILFCESKSLTNYLNNFNKNFKVITLYNPIRDEGSLNYSESKLLKKKTEFSYIGNMGSAQNIDMIVRCFTKANLENSILNMCGDGSLLTELSKKYAQDNIKWHGWLSGDDLKKIYSSSDFFILSLKSIGRQGLIIPSKVQSYFMNRKPIICISSGAPKDLIEEINAGVTCDEINNNTTIQMYKKALQLSEKDRMIMGDNSYQYYLKHFTKKSIVNIFLNSIK